MRRGAVKVEVVFLHILAVVALAVGEPEETFLENGILAVPEADCKAEDLFIIGDPRQSVFAPAVGTGTSLVVREVVPCVAVVAVVFADRAPLPFTQVRSPLFPSNTGNPALVQPLLFRKARHHIVLLRYVT